MATDQSRKTLPVPQIIRSDQTGSESGSRGSVMRRKRFNRLQRKCQMRSLNDQLARKIRQLEFDNNRLQNSVQTRLHSELHAYEEAWKTEVFEVKKLYDHELGKLRTAIDEEIAWRAKAELRIQQLHEEKNELMAKNFKLNHALDKMEEECTALQKQMKELKKRNEEAELISAKKQVENEDGIRSAQEGAASSKSNVVVLSDEKPKEREWYRHLYV